MQRLFFCLLALMAVYPAVSQKIDTTYYTAEWKPTTKQDAVLYGTTRRINDSTVLIRDYYMTDTLQCTGQKINGVKKGRWNYFYPNGKLKIDFEYINNGKNRNWFLFNEDSLKPNEKGIYHTVNHRAKFNGSEKTPNDYINANFVLPRKAEKKGFTSFDAVFQIVIDETGKVIQASENRGVAYRDKNGEYVFREEESTLKYDVDRALTEFLLNMPAWEPAIVRNQPVKSAHNIYIKYSR